MSNNQAGQSTREMQRRRRFARKALGIVALVALVCLVVFNLAGMKIGGLASVIISLSCIVLMKLLGRTAISDVEMILKREKDAARGADSEEKVGVLLDALDRERSQVFHDVVLGPGNIDHVVVRRDGAVFVIETKSHYGKITQDGLQLLRNGRPFEKDFIKQTLNNAVTLGRHLESYAERRIWVNGILCFARGFVQIRGPIRGIQTAPSKWLAEKLHKGEGNVDLADWLWENVGTLLALPTKSAGESPRLDD